MKKLLFLFAVVAMVLPGCKKINEELDVLGARLDKLEQSVPTIEEQISSIQESINALEEVDSKLDESIKALEASDKATAEEIAALKDADKAIEDKIEVLKKYVDDVLKSTKDWVSATFATLEQLNALSSEVAALKSLVDANKAEAAANLATAIANLETSLKSWVGEQLSNYYTIAEIDAKIAELQKAITDGDSALQQQLNDLKSQLETAKAELTEAYKKAIKEAIETNNGVIDQKIASEIAAVNKRIDEEVAAINAKIAAIEARLDNVETQMKDLLARIQSVSYIPTYDDGKATVKYADKISRVTLDFEVSPKDAVAELTKVWQSAVSVKAIYTQTRAISFIDMPIVKFEADATKGVISVTASGENLSAEFFNGTQSASARLSISDGNSSVTSEYVPMAAKAVSLNEVGVVSANEIWYTSTDGTIIQPYRTDVFGANIVSNTYKKGIGIIEFDSNVTSIGDYAFYYCTSLTSITIPDGVTSIGNGAFYDCTSLTSITIPDGVTSIGNGAFYDCTSLTAFYGKYASTDNRCLIVDGVLHSFASAGVTEYIIPDSVTQIGDYTFYKCTSLTSVTIPDSVTSIGERAFADCTSLTSVTIPDSVTSIGNSAFIGCTSLTSVTIGNSVTSIGEWAFRDCTSLTSVTIGNGVTSLGNAVFWDCSSLTAFYGKFASSDNRCLIIDGVLNSFAPAGLTSYTIPDSVTSIGEYAFVWCTSLTSVTIPDSVTSIGSSAFSGCTSLTSITIPDSVTSIGSSAFFFCTGELIINSKIIEYNYSSDNYPSCSYPAYNGIDSDGWLAGSNFKKLIIGNNITKIGDYAFYYCTSLTSVTIGNSVTEIGEDAFNCCTSLEEVYCKPTTPPAGDSYMFDNNALGRKIYVPAESVEAYKSAVNWKSYADYIKPYNF